MSAATTKCKTPNCTNTVIARDLCRSCYNREHHQHSTQYLKVPGHEGLVHVGVKGWGALVVESDTVVECR